MRSIILVAVLMVATPAVSGGLMEATIARMGSLYNLDKIEISSIEGCDVQEKFTADIDEGLDKGKLLLVMAEAIFYDNKVLVNIGGDGCPSDYMNVIVFDVEDMS